MLLLLPTSPPPSLINADRHTSITSGPVRLRRNMAQFNRKHVRGLVNNAMLPDLWQHKQLGRARTHTHGRDYMASITETFSSNHRHCDEMFAAVEQAVASNDRKEAATLFASFQAAMLHHLKTEEASLFPAFEARTGMTEGPTAMMRMEHEQMRGLLAEMAHDMDAWNAEHYLGCSETLLILMQQHNAKEEQILYPMTDQALADERDAIIAQLC